MQTFQFKSTSFVHFTVILAAGVCLMSFLIVDLNLHTKGYHYLFVAVVIMVSLIYFIADKNSKQLLNIGVSSSFIQISWVKQPAFKMKEDKVISWSHIKDYQYLTADEQDTFEMILINSEKIQFSINHSKEQKDTFNEFYVYFARTFHQLETENVIALQQSLSNLPKNFYQSNLGIGLAFLFGTFAVILLFYVFSTPAFPLSWRTICLALTFALGYIQLVWMHNKKRQNGG